MKKPRKRRDLNFDSKQSYIKTVQTKQGVEIRTFLGINDGKAIIKLIYWLIRYRLWQCRDIT